MLKPAQLYQDKINKKLTELFYDMRYMYFNGWASSQCIELKNNNTSCHSFVSINSKDEIIGYINYYVDWASKSTYGWSMISFDIGNALFLKDVKKVIDDVFYKYNFNKISWDCYDDNPFVRSYRKFIKKHGGVECGYHRDEVILLDGKLHDKIDFEILKKEYKK